MGEVKRHAVQPEQELSLPEILRLEVPQERVERLKQLTNVDDPDITEEVLNYLLRKQAQFVNVQYTRFLTGIKFTEAEVDAMVRGASDIHAHGGSEPFERLMLEDELGIEATRAGMRAIVIKTWYTPSASRNAMAQRIVNRFAEDHGLEPTLLFGGVTLNLSQGGLNPEAVKKCLKFHGMKYVWLPMVDSYHHRRVVYDDWSGAGVHLLDERERALPALVEICRICADNDLILATGHYPYRENAVVVEEAKKAGVRRIEIIHPVHIHSKHTIEQMKILAGEGAMLMLSGLGHLVFPLHETGPVYAVRMIKEVGADHLVYGSDFGQLQNFSHVLAAKWFIKVLLAYGATREEIVKIFTTNTARHIGLADAGA
ncbi:MAG: DUF6282 family protein [Armatimonadota bacterium]